MSGKRATVYAFGLAILLAVAFYRDMGGKELVLWQGILATGIPAAGLLLASLKTLPVKSKVESDNA
jgi:hypothetical protein